MAAKLWGLFKQITHLKTIKLYEYDTASYPLAVRLFGINAIEDLTIPDTSELKDASQLLHLI